jgi:hypothetical protein
MADIPAVPEGAIEVRPSTYKDVNVYDYVHSVDVAGVRRTYVISSKRDGRVFAKMLYSTSAKDSPPELISFPDYYVVTEGERVFRLPAHMDEPKKVAGMSPGLKTLLVVGGLFAGAFVVYQVVSFATRKGKAKGLAEAPEQQFLGNGRKFPKPRKYRRKVRC